MDKVESQITITIQSGVTVKELRDVLNQLDDNMDGCTIVQEQEFQWQPQPLDGTIYTCPPFYTTTNTNIVNES